MSNFFVVRLLRSLTKYIIPLIIISALLLCAAGAFLSVHIITSENDEAVVSKIDELTYTEDAAEVELAALKELTEKALLSDSVRGKLYTSMAEISYMVGDDMVYNRYAAYAMFYLNKAGDNDTLIYLYNKYVGRLYANGCYDSALTLLNELDDKCDFSLQPAEIQASYYLSGADVSQLAGCDCSTALRKAQGAINEIENRSDRLLNQAKHDLISARESIINDNFDEAESVVSGYSENDDFGLGQKQVYVVCDFRLPFYELSVKLALNKEDFDTAYRYADKYLEICDSYKFRAMKLNLLEYIVSHVPKHNDSKNNSNKYILLEQETSDDNLTELTEMYGRFLLADIDEIYARLDTTAKNQKLWLDYSFISVIALVVLALLYSFGHVIIDTVNRDGLTRLYNRRKFDSVQNINFKHRVPHCLIMFDIDNFKSVNDTYGHAQGDVVLRSIAGIVSSYDGRGISSYRYGGEELCIILRSVSEKRTREIAEEIRFHIEELRFDAGFGVTISGGVGISKNGEDAFKTADANLYIAKQNGKNQIV